MEYNLVFAPISKPLLIYKYTKSMNSNHPLLILALSLSTASTSAPVFRVFTTALLGLVNETFPIELTKFIYFSFLWMFFHSQHFFGLFNQVLFLTIFTAFAAFYSSCCFLPLLFFIYQVIENRCILRKQSSIFYCMIQQSHLVPTSKSPAQSHHRKFGKWYNAYHQ